MRRDGASIHDFESRVRQWTLPINGQYPRPWMSDLQDPTQASVFIVGRNQATPFPVSLVGSHDEYLDALFNRAGRSHSALYAKIRQAQGKGPSPTRKNIEALTTLLKAHGVRGVLETNVICYSTPMSADLSTEEHRSGAETGTRIFRELLQAVRPEVLISHGAGTRKDLERLFGSTLPKEPTSERDPVAHTDVVLEGDVPYRFRVVVIPALAPPGWNKWSSWAPRHLERVAALITRQM